MLINNKTARAQAIGVQVKKLEKGDTKLGDNQCKLIRLVPGVNEITDADWKALKAHPQIKKQIDAGDLEVVTEKDRDDKDVEKDGGDANLPGKAGDAVKAVNKCWDKDLLEKWLENENRPSVVKAINKQLKNLELSPEERAAMQGN